MNILISGEDRQIESSVPVEDSSRGCACTVEVDRVTETEWSELMASFDDANIYQTWSYGAVRWQEKNLSHLILKRSGKTVAMAQLRILRPGSLRFGIAYLRWGPMCQQREREIDPEIVQGMAEALRKEYVEKRGLHLEILPNAFSGSERAQTFQSAFRRFDAKPGIGTEKYRTLVIDLSPSLADLRKALDKKWRNQLNVAERAPLTISKAGSEDYGRFRALYDEMWQRKKFDTSVSVEEFGHIEERLPSAQKMYVWICEHAGKPVAGIVVSALGESAIYLLGATNDEGMKVKASYRLQWAMIEWLKERGTRFYDLGGIDPESNPGVYHFKSGFSGVDVCHISSFSACDNPISAAMVKTGQILRSGWRQRHARPAPGAGDPVKAAL
jgi:lipid II:glycine glycyltransferase (peptidoglycan interpeptide bridge formation enzyme)